MMTSKGLRRANSKISEKLGGSLYFIIVLTKKLLIPNIQGLQIVIPIPK